ncbi:MAG: hypothetical protein NZ556_05750 [Fimbriimonadales bacterium]|nr:hypothetical protein [Fimbriimonadales bacterium]
MKTRLTFEEIEQAIRQLPPEELKAFRQWFAEYDAALWDAELEADVRAGRLDWLISEATDELKQGDCKDL